MLRKRAFTLVELLVVIAIIALLAAILFPVFVRVREKARAAACQSNLKQISLGFMQYLSDYDGRFPHAWDIAEEDFGVKPLSGGRPAYVTSPSNAPIVWPAKLMPYLKSRGVFNCPSRLRNVNQSCSLTTYGYANNMEWKESDPVVGSYTTGGYYNGASVIGYGYNAMYLGGGQFPTTRVSAQGVAAPSTANCYTCGIGAPETALSAPAATILLIDNNFGNRGAGVAPAFAGIANNFSATGDMWCTADDSFEARHNGGLNVAFADGHVKWMKKEVAVYKPASSLSYNMANFANDEKFLWDR